MIPTVLNGVMPLPSQINQHQQPQSNGNSVENIFPMSAPKDDIGDGIQQDPSLPPLDHLGIIEDFHAPRLVVSQKHS